MKLTADERIAYLQAVWEVFQGKAKTQRDMTNSEYHLAAKWLDSGTPLFVVCRAMEDFDGKPKRLEALQTPVEKAVDYWVKAVTL